MPEPSADALSTGALAGLRVIDMASLYAAPLAASFLADFGADVVKLEPLEGDSFRGTRLWPLVSRGKRSMPANLRTERGVETLKRPVAGADVVVENYPAAVLEKRGISWDLLSALNPRLIMLSVSCFGATGPYAERPGSGTIGEAFGGLTHLTRDPDGAPMLPSTALGDAVGAMNAAPVDQIDYAADQGFAAVCDNGLLLRSEEDQARMGRTLARRGLVMGAFTLAPPGGPTFPWSGAA